MKTLDEVIKTMGYCNFSTDCNPCPYKEVKDCTRAKVMDALHYLKEYQRDKQIFSYDIARRNLELLEQNNPLTWDELKQMEGKPVWLEYNFHIGNKDFRDKSKRWCIVWEIKPWHDSEIIITENGFVLSKNEQIKCWQAYRKERTDATIQCAASENG